METKKKNCESTKKEMNSTKRIIGNTRQIPVKLGMEILDSVNDLENAMSDIGMRICKSRPNGLCICRKNTGAVAEWNA